MPPDTHAPEKTKKLYADEEILHLYQLAYFHLENGHLSLAEPIVRGISVVAPRSPLGWLGLAYLAIFNGDFEKGLDAARQAIKTREFMVQGLLMEAVCLLSLNDMAAAGTVLGEIGERIENGEATDPNLLRLFKGQLARYQR